MIAISDERGLLRIDEADCIRAAARAAMDEEAMRGSVQVYAATPEEIQEINRTARKIDAVTDVLSFPMAEPFVSPQDGYFGDIVICPHRAREQAAQYGHSEQREFAFLTIHGVLHIRGYDHEQPADEQRMIKKQRKILERMDLLT